MRATASVIPNPQERILVEALQRGWPSYRQERIAPVRLFTTWKSAGHARVQGKGATFRDQVLQFCTSDLSPKNRQGSICLLPTCPTPPAALIDDICSPDRQNRRQVRACGQRETRLGPTKHAYRRTSSRVIGALGAPIYARSPSFIHLVHRRSRFVKLTKTICEYPRLFPRLGVRHSFARRHIPSCRFCGAAGTVRQAKTPALHSFTDSLCACRP
jgi:hypothetical protein